MHTYKGMCLAHPLESWTPFDIVVNSAYALLTMPVTYKPTNVITSPFIRYSGTSAYNIYMKVVLIGRESFAICAQLRSSRFPAPSFEVRSRNTRRVQRSVRAIPQPTFLRQSFGVLLRAFVNCATVIVSFSFKTTSESSRHFFEEPSIKKPSSRTCCVWPAANQIMPTKKILSANKSSRRRLNTGSASRKPLYSSRKTLQ